MAKRAPAGMVRLETGAKFKSFIPRFQVNADKLELIFEVGWDTLPEGFLEQAGAGVRGYGELTWVQKLAAPDKSEEGHQDPTLFEGGDGKGKGK